jgi:hypothetical protein
MTGLVGVLTAAALGSAVVVLLDGRLADACGSCWTC